MARPVQYNITNKRLETPISIGEAPEGYSGEGFFASRLSDVVGLARKNSIWPLPFATSCCGIEFMALMASHYDLARFGSERVSFSPRQCDLLMVMGTIAKKMAPVLKQVYIQMAEPRWVLAMGACASSGGIFDTRPNYSGRCICARMSAAARGCLRWIFARAGSGRKRKLKKKKFR